MPANHELAAKSAACLTKGAVVGLSYGLEVTVVRPRPFGHWLAIRLGGAVAVVLVVMTFLGIRDHNSAALIGGLGAVGVMAVIGAIEIPLLLRVMARRQRRLLHAAPEGTLFAGRVSQSGVLAGAVSGPAAARRGLRQGTLLLNDAGICFAPAVKRGHQSEMELTWQQLSALRLTPSPASAGARLEAITSDGQAVSWLVPHYGVSALVQALDGIRASHGIGPAE